MATVGLGGDSEVTIDTRSADGPIRLGPQRAIPICRLAMTFPALHRVLDRQLAAPVGLTTHGRFLVSVAPPELVLTDVREIEVLGRLKAGPLPQAEAAVSGLEQRAASRLQARGLIRVATMTPTDASSMLGGVDDTDPVAAAKVASILARQTGSTGGSLAEHGQALAQQIIARLIKRSADFAVRVALESDGVNPRGADSIIDASLAGHRGATTVNISLSSPLTAIGAPAAAYYPRIAEQANTTAIIPEHADVANAVGAVVGRVRVRRSATITQPTRGQYRVHLDDQPTFGSVTNARAKAVELLQTAALADADAAGAATPELNESWQARIATIGDKEVFVEGVLTIEASGRPRI